MNSKVLFILSLVAISAADKQPRELYGPPKVRPSSDTITEEASSEYQSEESTEAANYNFEFAVEDGYSGADFNHQEEREEDNTQGSYSVQLPDGRRQTVKYYINGDSGYVAEVTYEGEAQYYEPEESEESEESSESAPIYEAPKPKSKPATQRPSYSAPKPEESEEEKEEEKPKASYGPPSKSYGAPQ
ncbi:pro-resilin-like [Palaemon carinicauda]|uniref:pro-resilin-like n=1 Tax=Palaemon carinicauda TaxID=392227 RepID=UPI0035B58356